MKPKSRTTDSPKDWHPELIKACIRQTGIALVTLSMRHGLHSSAVGRVLQRPWPRVEAIVAAYLGLRPWDIWPSRYDEFGKPRDGRSERKKHSAGRISAQRQKGDAA